MLAAILVSATLQAPARTGPFDLLIEDWVCRVDRLASGPVWRFLKIRRDGEGLTGQFGTHVWQGRTRVERPLGSLRITGRGAAGRLVWTGRDGVPIPYRLRVSGHEGLLFETDANVAPQRIAFRYGAFHLEVTTAQRDGSNAVGTHYSRPGMHMGVGSCDGGR